MLLRPLSVILDDVRVERGDLPQSSLPVPRPVLDSDVLGFPLRNFYLRNWSLRYSKGCNCSSHHCSVVERNPCLRESHDRDERARNNVQNTNWDETFSVPAVQGFTPLEVVVYLKTLTLLRQCLIFHRFMANGTPKLDEFFPNNGILSDTSSVSFSEEIDGDSLSESDDSHTGGVASPKVVETIPLHQLYSRSGMAISSSWPQMSVSLPTPSSASTSRVPRTVPLLPTAHESFEDLNARPRSGFTPTLRHSREQSDIFCADSRALTEEQTTACESPNTLFPLSLAGAAFSQMAVDSRVIPLSTEFATGNELRDAAAVAHKSTVVVPDSGVAQAEVHKGSTTSSSRDDNFSDGAEAQDEANGWVIC